MQFILSTKDDLDKAGRLLVQYALDEVVRETPGRSLEWYIQERNKSNTLATLFGEVHYERTYYKSIEGKGYCSLSDELVGIGAHDKMDLSGDRRGWIRKGHEWIRESEYVVDRYHLLKNIREASAHIEGACSLIWGAFNSRESELS